jgi:hypothetical protein
VFNVREKCWRHCASFSKSVRTNGLHPDLSKKSPAVRQLVPGSLAKASYNG